MFGCTSLFICCLLSSIMLFMADTCHSYIACHLQTVHPFPVIFISISTEITSSIQWQAWLAKIMPCSSLSFRSMHSHCISPLAYHAMFRIMLLAHCIVVDIGSFACSLVLGRAGRRERLRGFR